VIAGRTKRRFVRENAASVGVKRIREIIDEAERVLGDEGKRTILFLDEIHRFTKAQQDVLLGDVERGADHADRGNDGEPVVQREQRVDLAVDAVPAGAAERG
jgi:hypothetical protein